MPPRKYQPSAHDVAVAIGARILVAFVSTLAIFFAVGIVVTLIELAK